MSSNVPSGSGQGQSTKLTKAIGSLAKKQSDVTRQGTQKLKFVPTLKKKKEPEVKQEHVVHAVPEPADRGGERGRGRGEGRGRGRGRGATRPPVEMTASGPFAMGPAMVGNSGRRTIAQAAVPGVPSSSAGRAAALGAGLSNTATQRRVKKEAESRTEVDDEVYSDPDEGVEIVDIERVHQMDWLAPEALHKEKSASRKLRVKAEEDAKDEDKVDLSESEEEELEDIIEDFAREALVSEDPGSHQDRLYWFQFPDPFPTYESKSKSASITSAEMQVDHPAAPTSPVGKRVAFAPDTKPDSPSSTPGPSSKPSSTLHEAKSDGGADDAKVDGIIGQLEIYQSGAVKMRLTNGILLDVAAATQPSFLQQAVHLDRQKRRLCILGEVNKRFVVSPNVDALLSAMEAEDQMQEEQLIAMDTT